MKKVVGLGDMLISLSPKGYLRIMQAHSFDIFYTGAEANVCVSLSQFGIPTKYVTRLPDNEVGKTAIGTLRRFGIDTDNVAIGGDRIGLLYLEKGAAQRPSKVIYDRKNSAMCEAKPEDFNWENVFNDAQWLHFTGITPALSSTVRQVVETACQEAKKRGITVSCDLNYRKNLWTTEEAKSVMSKLLQYVDVLIANEEDAEKVLGIKASNTDVNSGRLDLNGYIEVADKISKTYGIPRVATTLRKSISASDNVWSAMLYHDGKAYSSRKYDIHIVNRVGGGDSFAAGLIYGIISGFDDQKTLEFATAASCLKHSIEFDFNLVTADEVMSLVNGNASGRVQR